jgi:4-hydroxybenzoate polyprenyltransferase
MRDGPHPPRARTPPSHRRTGPRLPFWRTIRAYLLLPHLAPVLLVELATTAFAVIAWGGVPPTPVLVPLLLAMLGGQLAIGAVNEIVDLPLDTQGKPWKPLPSGEVSLRGAWAMAVAGLAMMTVCGVRFGLPSFGLLALGTGLGIAYDLWLKPTRWSWLPYVLALPLLPIWVFAALGKPDARLLLLYPLGALATIGVHFAQALPDVATDRAAGLQTVTSRLGSGAAFAVAWLAMLTAPVLAGTAARWLATPGSIDAITVAGGIAVLACGLNLALLAIDRRIGTAACFPLVALSTLVSGVAWTLAVAAP